MIGLKQKRMSEQGNKELSLPVLLIRSTYSLDLLYWTGELVVGKCKLESFF